MASGISVANWEAAKANAHALNFMLKETQRYDRSKSEGTRKNILLRIRRMCLDLDSRPSTQPKEGVGGGSPAAAGPPDRQEKPSYVSSSTTTAAESLRRSGTRPATTRAYATTRTRTSMLS